MPLINLTTDLKSLRYGGDRPGGGSSGLPYIVSPYPNAGDTQQFPLNRNFGLYDTFYNLNKETHDYPIRGGSVDLDGATGRLTTPAGRIDRLRIQKFLEDPQRGTLFLLKQVGLQLTNPKTQVQGSLSALGSSLSKGFLESTRVYNATGVNTIQQVLASGTGTHIPRHGLIPDYNGLFSNAYEAFVRSNNTEGTNRLVILSSTKLRTDGMFSPAVITAGVDYGISTLSNEILNYQGGPGSTYGIGNTVVRRATNTNIGKTYNSIAFSYDTIMNQQVTVGDDRAHQALQDFRATINNQVGRAVLPIGNYLANNLETRLNIGNPGGTKLVDRVDYTTSSIDGQDKLNNQSLFYYDTTIKPWSATINNQTPAKDMIKFVFECLSNDEPGNAVAIFFRSFLTNISDNHQAELNSFKYLGRGETFRTYQGFDRSISFTFKITAFSRAEMKPLYKKLNHLASQVYPDYSPISQFMRGSVVKLTIGDYLYRVPGFLESVNITLDDNAAWEIALNDDGMRELPQMVTVQCSFKPIHNFLPRREKFTDPYVPLIADTDLPFLDSVIAQADQPNLTKQVANVSPLATSLAVQPGIRPAPNNPLNVNTLPIQPPRRPATISFGNLQTATVPSTGYAITVPEGVVPPGYAP